MLICATGSRSLITAPSEIRRSVYQGVLRELQEQGATAVMSGMAEGFDECVAKAAVELGLPLHAVVPNFGYGRYYWGRNSLLKKDRFDLFMSYLTYAADNGSVEYVIEEVHNTTGIYANGKHSNFLRNDRMVERVAEAGGKFIFFDGGSRGTRQCLESVARTGIEAVEITAA